MWSIEHSHYLRPSLLTDTILCCSQFSETPSTPETLETRRMSYLRPSLRIVRIIRHRSEAGEEQRPVCWASGTLWTEGKETCIKAPYLEGIIHLSETPSTPETLETRPMSYLRPSLLIVRIIRHRSEAGEEQSPVCWDQELFEPKARRLV